MFRSFPCRSQREDRIPATAASNPAKQPHGGTWQTLFLRAVFGGWLIALIVWILHAGSGIVGQILVVWLLAFVIQAAGFSHSVAGAVEVLYLANQGAITYFEWFWNFQTPVTLGNIVGGVVFVALVNYAQAVGAGRDIERAERRRRSRQIRDDRKRQVEEEIAEGARPGDPAGLRHPTRDDDT